MLLKNRITFPRRYGIGVALAVASGSAMADLPTEVTAAFTSLSSDGAAMIAAGWPVLVVIFGGLILMKIFKKVGSRAT